MNDYHLELSLIARQINEKRKFCDYDRAIKNLQCHQINAFLPASGLVYDYDVPVYSCKFSPTKSYYNILAIANENGTVCINNVNYKNSKTYVQTHNNSVFDLAWMPGEQKLVTVSGDHTAKLWDCSESDPKMISEFRGHSRSVKCVYFKPDNTAVFATGSRDGSLILWDTRSSTKCSRLPASKVPDQIIPSAAGTSPFVPKKKYCPMEASQSNSVTGIIFQNDNTLISSGSFDQCIRIWDMRKTYSRTISLPLPKCTLSAAGMGFSHICINPFGTKLYANCMDSYIYCFDINSYDPDPIAAFYGHQNGSFYVKSSVSRDGAYLMSGSTDKLAYVWNTLNAEKSEFAVKPLVTLPGHNAEVVCIAMSYSGDMTIASCSDDGTYRLWYPYQLKKKDDDEEEPDSAFASDWSSNETISTVRTQWRNKRKLDLTNEPDPVPNKTSSIHSRICQFYSKNLSSSCICQGRSSSTLRQNKRPATDDEESEDVPMKRRCSSPEINERTPPRENEITPKTGSSFRRPADFQVKSKRKLADMPNFIEEEKNCKKICNRILSPIKENVASISNNHNLESIRDYDARLGECQLELEINSETTPNRGEFSSPTSNLPNYVEDGTSPYLHRCPRTNQKENVDWLTKYRKENLKQSINVTPDDKKPPGRATTPTSLEKSLSAVKRRLNKLKASPAEDKLHEQSILKYFKVSGKSEINLASQEIKKSVEDF